MAPSGMKITSTRRFPIAATAPLDGEPPAPRAEIRDSSTPRSRTRYILVASARCLDTRSG